jgi:hypothetical protein
MYVKHLYWGESSQEGERSLCVRPVPSQEGERSLCVRPVPSQEGERSLCARPVPRQEGERSLCVREEHIVNVCQTPVLGGM